MNVKPAARILESAPYLFAEIDRIVERKKREGVEVISFGVGDPDLPSPPHVVERLRREAGNPANHRYPSYRGMPRFREAAARWFEQRFGTAPDPEEEVLALIGSKEGIAHFPLAFIDPGDVVLVPDPAYPVYSTAARFAGGVPVAVPLQEETGFIPRLEEIPRETWRKAKVIFLNYPNNPTGAVADLDFFERLVYYAKKYEVIVAHDNAYSEIAYDGYRSPSLLQVKGAKDIGIEFHSLSKTYNMTGWRIGFAVGGAEVIGALGKVKTNIDSGVFNAVQHAAVAALEGPAEWVKENVERYRRRRDFLVHSLRELGWEAPLPRAALYVWMKVPDGYTSEGFAKELLEKAAVVVAPGSAYGRAGEGFVRFSLTLPDERLREGVERLRKAYGRGEAQPG